MKFKNKETNDTQTNTLLLVITSLFRGGAETQLVNIAIKLIERNWKIIIVTLIPSNDFVSELRNSDIKILSLNMQRGKPDILTIFKMGKIINKYQPDIVHSHMVHANLLIRFTRLFYKIPILISTTHNINEGGRIRELAYQFTDTLSDLTTTISKNVAENHIKRKIVTKEKLKYIPNGINLNKFKKNLNIRLITRKSLQVNNEFVWLAVGRIEKQKDYGNLIDAIFNLTRTCSNIKLFIIGIGSQELVIKEEVKSKGLQNIVKFLGLRKDIPNLMNAADAYVMSSAYEGLPIVLLEAAATGLPIVATDVGGNSEIVIDNRTGILVPPKNSIVLTQALKNIMSLSEEERLKMGSISIEHIRQNYDIDKIANIWDEIYNKFTLNSKKLNIYA